MVSLTRNTQTFNLEAEEYVALRATSATAVVSKFARSVPDYRSYSGAWSAIVEGPGVVIVTIAAGTVDYSLGSREEDLQDLLSPLLPQCLTVADTTQATFVAQAAAAVVAKRPLYLDKMVVKTGDFTLPDGLTLVSDWSGGFTGTGQITLGNDITTIGIVHQDITGNAIRFNASVQTQRYISIQDKFINVTGQAVSDPGAPGSANHTAISFDRPYFRNCGYAMNLRRCTIFKVDRPYIDNTGSISNYGIELNGGSNYEINDPYVIEGRSGVIAVCQATTFANNIVVKGGTFINVNEEALGVDSRANELTNSALYDWFRLDGSDNGGVVADATHLWFDWTAATIQTPGAAPGGTLYANLFFQALTGANRGKRWQISGAPAVTKLTNTARWTTTTIPAADIAAFAAGDEIAVIGGPYNVRFIRPTIYLKPTGTNGMLSAWGAGDLYIFQPRIYGAGTNRSGLQIRSVSGIQGRSTRLRLATHRAQLPCANVQVIGAELHNCDLHLRNNSYGSHADQFEVAYTNHVRGTRLFGDARLIQSDWRDNADNFTPVPVSDPALVDAPL